MSSNFNEYAKSRSRRKIERHRSQRHVRRHVYSIAQPRSIRAIDAISVSEIDRSRDRLTFYLMAARSSMTGGQPVPCRRKKSADALIVIYCDRDTSLRERWTSRSVFRYIGRYRPVGLSKAPLSCCSLVASLVRRIHSVSKKLQAQKAKFLSVLSETLD